MELGWVHGAGWVRKPLWAGVAVGLYQGLVGRQHGGIGAVPVQWHQRHGAELLLGEVRGGAPAQDHGVQVIMLCTRTGSGAMLGCPDSPSGPSTASLHPPEP